jgi:tetratricopeptide (TPR) repeat protein
MTERLLADLDTKIQRYVQAGDASGILNAATAAKAGQLWDAVRAGDGDLNTAPIDALAVLARLYWFRHIAVSAGGDPGGLRMAVTLLSAVGRRSIELVPEELRAIFTADPDKPASDQIERLTDVAHRAYAAYTLARRRELLDVAVACLQEASVAAAPSFPDRGSLLTQLASGLRIRFEETGERADIDGAVRVAEQAVAATPDGHPERVERLSHLRAFLRDRFEHTGDLADIDTAVSVTQQAVSAAGASDANLAMYLSDLDTLWSIRFERTGDAADLDAAIDSERQAAEATVVGDSRLGDRLSNLALSLLERFDLNRDLSDLDAAVGAIKRAVAAHQEDHPHYGGYLATLVKSLLRRFEETGDGGDLNALIDASQRALLASLSHSSRAAILANLSFSLRKRFDLTRDAADLDASIDAARQALALALPDDRGKALLSQVAWSLRFRFERKGDAADLDAAIDNVRQAIAATSPAGSDFATAMYSLGSFLLTRFDVTGAESDLDAAIDAGQRALAASPADPHRPVFQSQLAMAIRARFKRSGNAADLDAAIDLGRESVAASPGDHRSHASHLSQMGNSLLARFEREGGVSDLDGAIDATRQALASTSADDPDRAIFLGNLCASLAMRFELSRSFPDLEAAIAAGLEALSLAPSDHPNRAKFLINIAICLMNRFNETGDTDDLDAGIRYRREASQIAGGMPGVRLAAARRWATAAAESGHVQEAAEAYATAVDLLHTVAWHGLDRATRREQLAQWGGLVNDAAAYLVSDGRRKAAVELLEQGRSILWTQALNLRSDLTQLAERAPDLAAQLERIRSALDLPVPEPASSITGWAGAAATMHAVGTVETHRQLARQWDEALSQARALDGFSHLLTTAPYSELAASAVGGPVVIVNASNHGCHALVVEASREQPLAISLPDLTLGGAQHHASMMVWALADSLSLEENIGARKRRRQAILDVLDWLWEVLAEPVLSTLGHTEPHVSGRPWPRVWWCPTGPLGVLPIHAAGHHPRLRSASAGTADCVLDRVISSYTPTLTALARARQPITPAAQIRHLTVGMPATPGLLPLPAVQTELEVLARHFPPSELNHQLEGSRAIRATVLSATAGHSWVHMACHAGQEIADPDGSGFFLWDRRLTISDLAAQPTQLRELAFLSACQTAAGSLRHTDEAIHLAAAMQFVGYRHVIATMWSIADSPAGQVADMFYAALKRDGEPQSRRAAESLHHAIRNLRKKGATNPLLWAPYAHFGP